MKADEKVEFEKGTKEKFSYFEELSAKVDELKDVVNEHAEILRQNNLARKETTEAAYFDEDNVYRSLE